MADDVNCNEVFQQHIQRAAGEVYPGDLVTKWIALVETMDTDGERALIVTCTPNAKAWDNLGMLQHAIQLEQSGQIEDD